MEGEGSGGKEPLARSFSGRESCLFWCGILKLGVRQSRTVMVARATTALFGAIVSYQCSVMAHTGKSRGFYRNIGCQSFTLQ